MNILGEENKSMKKEQEEPWNLFSAAKYENNKNLNYSSEVNVTKSNLVYVEKTDLPSSILNRIIRLAAFQNPEFHRVQKNRLSTYNIPRMIICAEETSCKVAPRLYV